jgi:hypothetical protein
MLFLKMSGKIIPGDLFFFLKEKPKLTESLNTTFVDAVCSVSKIDSRVFHVGLFIDEITVIHATTSRGVIKEALNDAIAFTKPPIVEIYRINCSETQRQKAIEFAFSALGSKYNDIFSPKSINSNGEKAFYCCQLISKAYENIFNSHTLNFMDANGKLIDYWIKYFDEKNEPIPQGLPGSHPSILKSSHCLTLIKIIEIATGNNDENNNFV